MQLVQQVKLDPQGLLDKQVQRELPDKLVPQEQPEQLAQQVQPDKLVPQEQPEQLDLPVKRVQQE